MHAEVISFLQLNGFIHEGSIDFDPYYTNGNCIIIDREDYYEVRDNSGHKMYSIDLNIYWLIGILTYYGLMDKNYKDISEPTGSFT